MHYNIKHYAPILHFVVAPSLTPDALQFRALNMYALSSCSSLSHPGCTTMDNLLVHIDYML